MASTQELETKVLQLERMVKFVLTAFQVHDVNNPFSKPSTLLDEYYRVQAAGLGPNLIIPPGVRDAEVVGVGNDIQAGATDAPPIENN